MSEDQNTLNITPNFSPSPELEKPVLQPTEQSYFWNPSTYINTFNPHSPTGSAEASNLTTTNSWQQSPLDTDLGDWWTSQGL